MTFAIVDIEPFLDNGMFRQDHFLTEIDRADWAQYTGRKVLVRGCGSAVVPPWAYMVITARLTGIAASVRYGNEHDHVVVHRTAQNGQRT